jgi:hypothetical protein
MSDIINIKDFYDHETRISIVENAIISIEKKFDQIDKRFERLENKMDSQFKWIIGSIGALSLTTIVSLFTMIIKMH